MIRYNFRNSVQIITEIVILILQILSKILQFFNTIKNNYNNLLYNKYYFEKIKMSEM